MFTLSLAMMLTTNNVMALTTSDLIRIETFDHWREVISGPYGGEGGEWFNDWWVSLDGSDYHPKRPPQQINVRAGERVDMIQILYEGHNGGRHGSEGGVLNRLRLYEGDRIIRVSGRSGIGPGAGIDQITFYTLNGRVLGPYGGEGGIKFDSGDFSSEGCHLGYISGKAGRRLDQLSLHWRCPREKQFVGVESPYEKEPFYRGSQPSISCANILIFILTFTVILLE